MRWLCSSVQLTCQDEKADLWAMLEQCLYQLREAQNQQRVDEYTIVASYAVRVSARPTSF